MTERREKDAAEARAIAEAFVAARQRGKALAAFPGAIPPTLAAACAVQEAAIALMPDRIAGWKVAGIAPEFRAALGAERLAGPVFAAQVHGTDGSAPVRFPNIRGGCAIVEAEFILRMGRDVTPDEAGDPARLADAVAGMHAGVEIAGSPYARINADGPCVIVSDFGNNNGLIVGPEIPGWRSLPPEALAARVSVNGAVAGEGDAGRVAGGLMTALAFLVAHLATRGRILNAGDYVSTGNVTGLHAVKEGDRFTFEFAPDIRFEAVAMF